MKTLERPTGASSLGKMSTVPETEYRNLLVDAEAHTARITLNRPDKLNALSLDLLKELVVALREVSSRGSTRVIVIEGAGRAFSAGHDLAEMIDREDKFFRELFG